METACSPEGDSGGDCRDKFKKNGSKDSPKSYSVMFSLGPLSPFISLQVTYTEPVGIVPRTFTENLFETKNSFETFLLKQQHLSENCQNQNKGVLNEDAFLVLIL